MPERTNPQHLRRRAESLRSIADGIIHDHKERQKLLEIAEEYERWAREAESKARAQISN
jgi:hypothetical protein